MHDADACRNHTSLTIGPRNASSCIKMKSIQLACRAAASAHMGCGRTSLYVTDGLSCIGSASGAESTMAGATCIAPAAGAAGVSPAHITLVLPLNRQYCREPEPRQVSRTLEPALGSCILHQGSKVLAKLLRICLVGCGGTPAMWSVSVAVSGSGAASAHAHIAVFTASASVGRRARCSRSAMRRPNRAS